HIAWGTRQSLVFRWVLYFCKMPNIFDALKQKCLTFLTVFLLENKKDTREISRIFYAAIAPDCGTVKSMNIRLFKIDDQRNKSCEGCNYYSCIRVFWRIC